jgi:hypothetical protein
MMAFGEEPQIRRHVHRLTGARHLPGGPAAATSTPVLVPVVSADTKSISQSAQVDGERDQATNASPKETVCPADLGTPQEVPIPVVRQIT